MRLEPHEARRRFTTSAVARLATTDGTSPHIVPVTFVVDGDTIAWVVDHKPKVHNNLRRLQNIQTNAAVSFLVDEYDEDWSRLWWARADGTARVLDTPSAEWVALLADKYRQYRETPPQGPLVLTEVTRWSGWSATAG